MRGTFLPVQLAFELPIHRVGVDHMHQMPASPGEVGGIEAPRMLEQGLLTPAPDRGAGRQGVDGFHDHVGLLG